ncbi:hypothetical protein ACTJJB_30025 [Chitinophaga sp. 22536]|uniref:hypothetical protein n=1 Tax=unclassified Chitinophaga TaxID=2619133 RepID=UPI003F858CF2
MQTGTDPLILTYQVYGKDHKPLTLSTEGEVCIVLEPNSTIKCEKIILKVPQGDDADCIFETSTATLTPPDKRYWSTGKSQVIHDDELDIDYMQWTLVNLDPNHLVPHGANCSVSGMVNSNAGTAQVVIKEKTKNTGDNDYKLRQGDFPIIKSNVPAFFLQNLIAIDPLNSGYPCGAIQQGYAVEIRWSSNGTSYELYQSGSTTPIYSGTNTSYTLNNGITDTTTFFCIATNANGDKLFESFTLTVINPALAPLMVNTANSETVQGEMTTNIANCNTVNLSSGAIATNGDPNTINITTSYGPLNLAGNFSVGGDATFGNTTVSDLIVEQDFNGTYPEITVLSPLSLAQPTITTLNSSDIETDDLTIQDGINFTGQQVSMFGTFTQIASGTNIPITSRKANTDGYAVLTIDLPYQQANTLAYGGISLNNSDWFYTNGSVAYFGAGTFTYGFLSIPVAAGTTWYYKGENLTSVSKPPTISVYWFPVGNDSASELNDGVSLPVTDNQVTENDPRVFFEQYTTEKKQRRSDLINAMEMMLDVQFDVSVKEEMLQQLMTL